jgi:hypothetical protein
MQTWIDSIRRHNGTVQELHETVVPPEALVQATPVVEPSRICFAQVKTVDNPGASFKTAEALCGKPQRAGSVTDKLTYEQDMVTCPVCQERLKGAFFAGASGPADSTSAGNATQGAAGTSPLCPPSPFLPPNFSHRDFLDVLLDVEALMAKQNNLQAELAAVEVLLAAARERDRVRAAQDRATA